MDLTKECRIVLSRRKPAHKLGLLRLLGEDIFLLAGEVKKEVGERWYENERARAVFVAAVADHIANVNKEDEPYRKDPSRVETEEMIIGRTISRVFRRR